MEKLKTIKFQRIIIKNHQKSLLKNLLKTCGIVENSK
nr:hypothetical protein BRACLTYN_BRACLTYN_CDS_0011 [Microvirus sp.]